MAAEHVFTTEDHSSWSECYDRLDSPSPYHAPEYLTRLAGNFEHESEQAKAFVVEDGDELVYYPFLERSLRSLPFAETTDLPLDEYSDIVSSWYYGGPIASTGANSALKDEFLDAFEAFCRETGIVAEFIRFDPNVENHAQFKDLEPTHNRQTIPVDLNQSPEDIWDGYEGRNQRAIKQALDTDIVIEPSHEPADWAAFHEIYTNAMEARDAAEHYRFPLMFFESLLEQPALATILIARYHDDVIGGFIVLHDDRIGHHYLSASNPDYWDKRVNNLLYHEVVMHMQKTGREVFDFQGGRPGVFKFKKGFSPDRGAFYIGKRTHLPEVYEQLVVDASSHGIDTASGYFPAYRVEQSN